LTKQRKDDAGELGRGADAVLLQQALARELREELSAKLISASHYFTLYDEAADEEIRYFLIDVDTVENTPEDTHVCWYTRKNYEANDMSISSRIYDNVYPKMIEEGLV
jgi:predicted lipid-binding transport protein (Tim44 family)